MEGREWEGGTSGHTYMHMYMDIHRLTAMFTAQMGRGKLQCEILTSRRRLVCTCTCLEYAHAHASSIGFCVSLHVYADREVEEREGGQER